MYITIVGNDTQKLEYYKFYILNYHNCLKGASCNGEGGRGEWIEDDIGTGTTSVYSCWYSIILSAVVPLMWEQTPQATNYNENQYERSCQNKQ